MGTAGPCNGLNDRPAPEGSLSDDPDSSLRGSMACLLDEILPQEGIAVWWEDWSPVADFVRRLRAGGTDVLAHCAAHPQDYQALHEQVRVLDVNEAAVQMMRAAGRAQLIGPLSAVLPYSILTFPRWLAAIAAGAGTYRGQSAVRRFDGELFECLITARLPAVLEELSRVAVFVVDVTSFRGFQGSSYLSTMQHGGRVAVMGALTASIAHEVKNPLAAIVANAGAARRWLNQPVPDIAEAQAAVASAVRDAMRARDIVDRTLSFIRPVPPRKETLDLPAIVNDAVLMLMPDLQRQGVTLTCLPEEGLPPIEADPIQLQQVLVNLMLNATQAMDSTSPRREITIRLTRQAGTLLAELADTGTGMAPAILQRLFEPFYSTKSGGIGMGLAISRACIEANGGRIWARSTAGVGTSIFFTLPITAKY